ncbi:hypothetical protein [Bradyrhizobium sp. dw_78]|uniref:hypothetical protein n=1 Tax=Bradyrhizobium sp. dw_78 TaxID=2719793 RepID=UPI001BD5DC0F|nr:hypothetical protein [Bradyrhizobium sp. dw_78]
MVTETVASELVVSERLALKLAVPEFEVSEFNVPELLAGAAVRDSVDQIAATSRSRTLRGLISAVVSACGGKSDAAFSGAAATGSGILASRGLASKDLAPRGLASGRGSASGLLAGAVAPADQISVADSNPIAALRAGAVACCVALSELRPSCATDGSFPFMFATTLRLPDSHDATQRIAWPDRGARCS